MNESKYSHSYSAVLQTLRSRLAEQPPGRIQILTGPRQVGKTTLLLELAREWGNRAIYAAADAPEAALPGWWELLWRRAEDAGVEKPAVILVDEIQYLPRWDRLLKAKADEIRRKGLFLHVVVTGSSAIRVGAGARETMAGRFERLQLLHWPAAELASRFHLSREEAVKALLEYGGYPGAVPLLKDPPRWREYLRAGIIEPAIGRDIMMMEQIRKPGLLRQVFSICCGHPAEIISLQKICGRLSERGALETVAHYLHVLQEAYLVAAVQKYSRRTMRRRSSPPKLIVLSQAVLAAMESGGCPSPDREPARWGRWMENTCMAHAWNAGQEVCYWRQEPLEVDMISSGSWGKWAIEIKSGPFTARDLSGITEFCRLYPEFRPLVICRETERATARDAGIDSVVWREYLLEGI